MEWTESQNTSRLRADALTFPFLPLLVGLVICLVALVLLRLATGQWQFLISIIFGVSVGLVVRLNLMKKCGVRQIFKLSEDSIHISGHRNYELNFSEIRGFSIISVEHFRSLVIYPKSDGFFSIGIPGDISNNEIVLSMPKSISYVTYIDEQSQRVNYA